MTKAGGMKIRLENAERGFVEYVREWTGCTDEEARKVMALYIKNKLVKLDIAMGKYKAKDGRFWEKDVLERAIEMVA